MIDTELSPKECRELQRENKKLKETQNRVEQQYKNSFDTIAHYFSEFSKEDAPSNLLNVLADFTRYIVQSDRCTLWLVDREKGRFWTKFAHGLDRVHELDLADGILGEVFITKEPILENNPYLNPHFSDEVDRESGYKTDSILAIPIEDDNGDIIGVFQAVNKLKKDGFSERDLENFQYLTAYTKTFLNIENLIEDLNRGGEEVTYLAERDKVTQLYNRQKMETLIFRFVERHIYFSLVLIRLDDFLNIAPLHRESVLVQFSNILQQSANPHYTLGKWEDAQFIVILKHREIHEAFNFAERVREFLSKFCFEDVGKQKVSFGVTEWFQGEDARETVRRVENALQKVSSQLGNFC
jgi:GGDEF domain-containing protein